MPTLNYDDLRALPPRSQVLAHWPNGDQKDHVATRISVDGAGAASAGFGLYGTQAWIAMANWGAELTVLHDASTPHSPDQTAFLRWLTSMDDPDDAQGINDRKTVTLTNIINRAQQVLASADTPPQSER